MPLKMGSITKALATGLVLKKEHTDDKKIRIRYCRGDDGLDGRKKRELDEEAKRVARKVKDVTKRMDEEDIVKESLRFKQKEEEVIKRSKEEVKRITELTRAEKNREWRMKKEHEVSEPNWRKVEERVRAELNCPCCGKEMAPPCKIFQCRDGHVTCEECWDQRNLKVCSTCKQPVSGRNIAIERISSIFFHDSTNTKYQRRSVEKSSTRSSSAVASSAPPPEQL